MWKRVTLVCIAGIWTLNLSAMSPLVQPLDQGF